MTTTQNIAGRWQAVPTVTVALDVELHEDVVDTDPTQVAAELIYAIAIGSDRDGTRSLWRSRIYVTRAERV